MKHKYAGGIYHPPLTIFERLDEVEIHVPEEDLISPLELLLTLKPIFQREIFLKEQICSSGIQNLSL